MDIAKVSDFNWLTKFGIIKLDESNSKYFNTETRKNFWVSNNLSTNCFECDVKFTTFLVRQHHCRICGNIFCSNCTSKQIQITTKNKLIKLRVCNNCFNICQNFSSYIEKKMIKEEIKEQYFYNIYENSKIENIKFLNFENIKKENEIKNNINYIYELILKNLIRNVLDEYFDTRVVNEWKNILFSLIIEVINNLRSSSFFLNDSININKYIKIKIIPYKDNSQCKVIPGFIMKKNIFKYIKKTYTNPKILLINIEKEFILTKLDNDSDSIQRNNAIIKIIEKKLELLNPDIILIGKYLPKLLLNDIKNNSFAKDKFFLFDVKKKSLQNIARCTDNIILSSLDMLGTNFILGKCKNFTIKTLKYKFQNEKEDKNEINIKEESYILVFEGKNSLLFNSIILSGKDKLFLKKIKNILKNILLPTARDLLLQKYLLYAFNMKIDTINVENVKEEEEKIYSIFEENRNYRPSELDHPATTKRDYELLKKNTIQIQKNNKKYDFQRRKSIVIFNKLLNMGDDDEKNLIKKNKDNDSNFFYKGFDLSIICKRSEYVNYSVIKISKTINNNNNINQIIEENNIDIQDDEMNFPQTYRMSTNLGHPIIEKNVHKIIGKYCKQPSRLFLSFYNDNKYYDKPLGRFIFELCKEAEMNCNICGISLSKHIHHLYKSNGRIKIKLISDKENDLDKIINHIQKYKGINNKIIEDENILDIYTYGYCNICSSIVTPLFKLPNEILNYSISRFFRFLLENISNENDIKEYDYNIKYLTNNNKCNHIINKDVSRIFVTKLGSWLFDYNNIIKYFISPLKLNDPKNNVDTDGKSFDNYNSLIEEYMNEASNNSKIILDMLNNLFRKQITEFESLLNDEKLYLFKTNINLLINIIVMGMTLIENFKINILSVYLSKEYILSNNNLNFFQYIVIIKKIYIKIIQIKTIANTIDKYIVEFNIISGILNGKIPFSYEENVKMLEGDNKDIPIEQQLFDIKVDKTPKININFENNSTYLKILSFIEYFDDKHNNYSCDFRIHDLSCIISTVLSSDDYLNLINNEKHIQFSDIKCQRIAEEINYDNINKFISSKKNNIIYLNIYKKRDKKNFDVSLEEEEIKEKTQQNKTYFDNSLIFNLSSNKFYINKNDKKEKKILEFLEKELCSDNKEEFNYTLINSYCNCFDNNKDNKMNKNFKSKEIKEEIKEEKNEKDKKIIDIMEANNINKEINDIKIKISEFNSLYITQQRELNIILKSLLKTKEKKKNNLSRRSSLSNKHLNDILIEKKKSISRKSSTSSRNSSEDEYEPKSLDSNNYDILNILNDNNNINNKANILPSFPYMPEFLKIFELKKKKYYEEEILEKKYPEYKIKVYFPHQFEALRTTFCATNEEFIKSIRKSIEWSVSGGKSKANFYKTFDNKYIVKNVSEMEFNMFIESALNYFKHISKYLFHKMPSAIGKLLGAYHIKVKIQGEKDKNYYLIYMENIYYGMLTKINNYTFNSSDSNIMVYDLKGSKLNRYVKQNMKKPGKVLLDTNFLEDFNGEPLFFDFNVFQILQNALTNDSQFLKEEGVIDYSLLIIFEYDNTNSKNKINEENGKEENKNNFKIIRLGIIDYLRKYTWDKQIESYSKKFIHGFKNPTIINPDSYCERFMRKIKRYFVGI